MPPNQLPFCPGRRRAGLSLGVDSVGIDGAQELLESRLGSQDVEVRFDRRVDQRGAAAERAGFEQRERFLGVAALRIEVTCRRIHDVNKLQPAVAPAVIQ